MPPIDRLSGLLLKIELLWAVLWASNMPKMGELDHDAPKVPDLLVSWGEEWTTLPMPHPLSAFGASIFVPPVEAWCHALHDLQLHGYGPDLS